MLVDRLYMDALQSLSLRVSDCSHPELTKGVLARGRFDEMSLLVRTGVWAPSQRAEVVKAVQKDSQLSLLFLSRKDASVAEFDFLASQQSLPADFLVRLASSSTSVDVQKCIVKEASGPNRQDSAYRLSAAIVANPHVPASTVVKLVESVPGLFTVMISRWESCGVTRQDEIISLLSEPGELLLALTRYGSFKASTYFVKTFVHRFGLDDPKSLVASSQAPAVLEALLTVAHSSSPPRTFLQVLQAIDSLPYIHHTRFTAARARLLRFFSLALPSGPTFSGVDKEDAAFVRSLPDEVFQFLAYAAVELFTEERYDTQDNPTVVFDHSLLLAALYERRSLASASVAKATQVCSLSSVLGLLGSLTDADAAVGLFLNLVDREDTHTDSLLEHVNVDLIDFAVCLRDVDHTNTEVVLSTLSRSPGCTPELLAVLPGYVLSKRFTATAFEALAVLLGDDSAPWEVFDGLFSIGDLGQPSETVGDLVERCHLACKSN